MAFIDWTHDNEVGIKKVDEQHKHLFALLNRLHDAVAEGKEQGELFAIMDELIEYTVVHFQTEERLYVEYDYPGYENHKAVHDDLVAAALDLQAKLREGSATLSFELLEFLHDWLMGHTLGLDQEMSGFLKAKGVS